MAEQWGRASGWQVALSTVTKMYQWSQPGLRRGPTMSSASRSNDTSMMGISTRAAAKLLEALSIIGHKFVKEAPAPSKHTRTHTQNM